MNWLRYFIFILILPFMGFKSEGVASYYQVVISPNSEIAIRGQSNINEFTCGYSGLVTTDTLYIRTNPQGNDQLLYESKLKVKVQQFDCGMRMMTRDMMELLREEEFPYLNIRVDRIEQVGNKVHAVTEITIAEKTKKYTITTDIRESSGWSQCQGNLNVNIRNFGIEPPTKFFGTVKVDEMITIEFDLKLKIIRVG